MGYLVAPGGERRCQRKAVGAHPRRSRRSRLPDRAEPRARCDAAQPAGANTRAIDGSSMRLLLYNKRQKAMR